MKRILFLNLLCLFLFFLGCSTAEKQKKEPFEEGAWRAEMNLGKATLPFRFAMQKIQGQWTMTIFNGEEEILVDEINIQGDSLYVQLPYFESEFRFQIQSKKKWSGVWVNHYQSSNYLIPVQASWGEDHRFRGAMSAEGLSSRYRVRFSPNEEEEFSAVGLFDVKNERVFGTFATETGDYRHLEGGIRNDSLFLSTFDGSHAFLFQAAISEDSLSGVFYSGTHWKESWVASSDQNFELRDPDSLTFLKSEDHQLTFSLPNSEGDTVRWNDSVFMGKVQIIQIMGSWCPNCLDETRFLSELYMQRQKEGLEIVALAFERSRSKEKAIQNIRRLKEKTGAAYPILLGGATREDKAEEVLPMLNHIMSYPTAIFIDRKGVVRKIHTGFYGPGTGEYYRAFVEETNAFLDTLLAEQQ